MNVMNLFPQLSVFKINRAELKLCIFWKIQLVHFDNLALSVLKFGYYEESKNKHYLPKATAKALLFVMSEDTTRLGSLSATVNH